MRSLNITILSLIIFALNSCEESFTDSIPRYAIANGFLSTSDTFRVNISYSTDAFKFENDSFINNSVVYLVLPDKSELRLIPDLTNYNDHIISQKGYYRLPELIPERQSGDYELRVENENQKTLSAKDSIPNPVILNFLRFVKDTLREMDMFQIEFKDPANSENYYSVSLNTFYYITRSDGLYKQQYFNKEIRSSNTFIESSITNCLINQLVFSDMAFPSNPNEVTMNFEAYNFDYPQYWDSIVCEVQLHTLSKSYYNYITTYFKQNQTEKDFYSNPVSVYSNIEGGYGIFAGYSTSTKKMIYSKGVITYN